MSRIFYSTVYFKDGCILSKEKGHTIRRRGDTLIVQCDKGGMNSKIVTMHRPWVDVREAEVDMARSDDAAKKLEAP